MPYTVKLKNQSGEEVNYSEIEQLAIPLASGTDNAFFMARYNVTKANSPYINYDGGNYAANKVDYLCRVSSGSGKHVPTNVTVKINGQTAANGNAYVYTRLTDTEAIIKLNGTHIIGDVYILAEAVTPS